MFSLDSYFSVSTNCFIFVSELVSTYSVSCIYFKPVIKFDRIFIGRNYTTKSMLS